MNPLQRKNQHLMWRAGFGPAASQLESLQKLSPQKLYKGLLPTKPLPFLDATDDYLKGFFQGLQVEKERQMLGADEKRDYQKRSREAVKSLNLLWLDEMVYSNAQLAEKMAFFWHGHFATRNLNVFYQQQLLDVVRQGALGSFRALLHNVSKTAAMLFFLNAQQNRKGRPNENFAREVMELFTLGRGHYSENDVKEAARAFTGWTANLQGEFLFRRNLHDSGTKTIFGKTGNFEGEEVLDLLLEKKETALFLTEKLYRFFVNERVDKEKLSWLANRFYQSDYQIGKLMEDMFTSDWFYEDKNIGGRIKSPVELIAGLRRMLPMEIENEDAQLVVQKLLGQTLFYPPNVAGWPGGRAWIDSSTLMVRLRLPQLILDMDELNMQPKADDDQMMGRMAEAKQAVKVRKPFGGLGKPIRAVVDWPTYTKNFDGVKREKLLDTINAALLQVEPTIDATLIKQFADSSSRDAFLKTATLQIMSTPEYQLC